MALEASFNNKPDTGDPVMSAGQYATLSPDMLLHARHNVHTSGFDSCVTHSPQKQLRDRLWCHPYPCPPQALLALYSHPDRDIRLYLLV